MGQKAWINKWLASGPNDPMPVLFNPIFTVTIIEGYLEIEFISSVQEQCLIEIAVCF